MKIQPLSAFHGQAVLQSLNLLWQKPLLSSITILVIAIALALPAFFWVFIHNFSQFTKDWQRGGHISLYLKPMNDKAQQALLEKLQAREGVRQVQLKSPADGLAELKKQEGMHDIMRYLPENPLPAVIEILPAFVDSPSQVSDLARNLQLMPEIDEVKLDMEWLTRLHIILTFAAKIAHILMLLLAMTVILIIVTTLRLAIHNRQEEIKVLKLIGANDAFIQRPFLYLSLWYGMGGAVLAVIIVNLVIFSLTNLLNQLAAVYQMHYSLSGLSIRQILPLITFAIIMALFAAWLSVKRQLLSIEP